MEATDVLALTAIDMFSGIGGLTSGLKNAGFEVVAAIEIDAIAGSIYADNHPEVTLHSDDIRMLDPIEVLGDTKQLDLLAGCPPCQGFSTTRTLNGSRPVDDERNSLVDLYADWVEILNPRALIFENVPGLARDWRFQSLLDRLDSLGYPMETGADYIFNTADYGIPQRRHRLVVRGILGSAIQEPAPFKIETTTVRDAFVGLGPAGASGDPLHDLPERRSDAVKKIIRAIPQEGGSRSELPDELVLDCHRRTTGFKDVYGRMAWDKPAPTITGGCFNPSKGRFLHPVENRAITLREAALLQGFPANYSIALDGGKQRTARMIGNAVPPKFVEHHARSIRDQLIQLS